MSKPSNVINIASSGVPGYALRKEHGKVVQGIPLFTPEASKHEPKSQIVSQKLSQHVFMFLQRYKVLLSRSFLRETQSSHCGTWYRPVFKPAFHSLKRTLGKYLKVEAAHGALQTTTPPPLLRKNSSANTHVQTLTFRTNRSEILRYVPQCTQLWGRWSSDDPACKTMAAKFTKCLES